MRLEIDIAEHHYNNIMALDSVSLGRAPYKGIIMYSINAIKHGKVLEQEPTTENDSDVQKAIEIIKADSLAPYSVNEILEARDLAVEALKQMTTTKNDLGVDCISRADAIRVASGYCHPSNVAKELAKLPSVTPQPRWIPVSEYLPVTNDEVLVTYIVNGNAKKRYVETANCFDGEWSSVNDEYRIPNTKIEIIAWCEMPKPYKAEVKLHESEET